MESSRQQQRRVRPGGGLGRRLTACWSRWRRKVAHEVEVPWRSSDCDGDSGSLLGLLVFVSSLFRLVLLPLPEIPPPNSRFQPRLPYRFSLFRCPPQIFSFPVRRPLDSLFLSIFVLLSRNSSHSVRLSVLSHSSLSRRQFSSHSALKPRGPPPSRSLPF